MLRLAATGKRAEAQPESRHGLDELAATERLDHVVVRAEVERADLVILVIPAGQDEDRQPRAATAKVRHELEAVPGRQVQIDDRDEGILRVERAQRQRRALRQDGRQACLSDEERQKVEQLPVVIDDQHPATARAVFCFLHVTRHPPGARVLSMRTPSQAYRRSSPVVTLRMGNQAVARAPYGARSASERNQPISSLIPSWRSRLAEKPSSFAARSVAHTVRIGPRATS